MKKSLDNGYLVISSTTWEVNVSQCCLDLKSRVIVHIYVSPWIGARSLRGIPTFNPNSAVKLKSLKQNYELDIYKSDSASIL